MSDGYLKIRKEVVDAGKDAVRELIKIAKERVEINGDDISLAADRLKNAAAAKKVAVFDALEILDKLQEQEEFIKQSNSTDTDGDYTNFAERRAKGSNKDNR